MTIAVRTSRQWRGVIREYADRLDVSDATPVVTLGEGGTPLIEAPALSARTGARVFVKFEGMNPTGSFKDRGMTMAISKAVEHGAKAVICASTGNTSASAAAYATHAGITAAVLVPEGKIALGKMAQALVHGAKLLQVDGNFDDCLELAQKLSVDYPVALVNSVNPDRLQGQKTAAFEICDVLGGAPDVHCRSTIGRHTPMCCASSRRKALPRSRSSTATPATRRWPANVRPKAITCPSPATSRSRTPTSCGGPRRPLHWSSC